MIQELTISELFSLVYTAAICAVISIYVLAYCRNELIKSLPARYAKYLDISFWFILFAFTAIGYCYKYLPYPFL